MDGKLSIEKRAKIVTRCRPTKFGTVVSFTIQSTTCDFCLWGWAKEQIYK